MSQTMYEKLWEKHVVYEKEGEPSILYIDLHLVNEVTSPQAFEGLRLKNRTVRRNDLTFATADHNVPTTSSDRVFPFKDQISQRQVEALIKNCEEFDVPLFDLDHDYNGIVHIIGPELGLTTPGKSIVCGDSHTSTHGAFGALAFGIGTSEIEHVLATQTLPQSKSKTMNVEVNGILQDYVTAKDVILGLIGKIGNNGGSGYAIEFTGETIRNMSMEERMTVCNMAIEAGARTGMVAPDEKTYAYLKDKPFAPKGEEWEQALQEWEKLKSDDDAVYDKTISINAHEIAPFVTWGTNPSMVVGVTDKVPSPDNFSDPLQKKSVKDALAYMELTPGTPIEEISLDRVFIGSCTNARIEDLRMAAKFLNNSGGKVSKHVQALVVPGSFQVKKQAEKEGLHEIFIQAGFEWREAGCSMCLGMNPDMLGPGERCASTSNRNFEGRQGRGGRTHLVSPIMAAAAAVKGRFVDISSWSYETEGVIKDGV